MRIAPHAEENIFILRPEIQVHAPDPPEHPRTMLLPGRLPYAAPVTAEAALRGALVLALSVLLGACSARSQVGSASPGWPADEAEILAATSASSAAWNRGDLPGHLAIYVDSVTFMTGTGPRPGVQAIHDAFTRSYFVDGMPKQQLRFEEVVVRPLGRDAALQTGRFVLSGGGEADQSGWFTLVWIRTPEGWRAVHDHSS